MNWEYRYWDAKNRVMYYRHHNPKPEWVEMRCAKVLDFEGKKCYDGDVLKDEQGSLHEIFFNEADEAFELLSPGAAIPTANLNFHLFAAECVKVGNVYENPEIWEA